MRKYNVGNWVYGTKRYHSRRTYFYFICFSLGFSVFFFFSVRLLLFGIHYFKSVLDTYEF